MFATLLGGLPRPDADGDLEALIQVVVQAQEEAGLEPITDGRLRDPGLEHPETAVGSWRFAAGLTDRAVKQALLGPYSFARRSSGDGGPDEEGDEDGGTSKRATRTMAHAANLRQVIEALGAAGCPMVEIEESEAHLIGADEAERELFRAAHHALIEGIAGTHLSLSIVGRAAASAGIETILTAPYASLAVDLIAGPDNWNLVTTTPGDKGIVVGAMGNRETSDEPKEVLLWGAHYAASTAGRGSARVGIGSAGSFANLTWEAAVRKLTGLGAAARLAALPPGDELATAVDPRSVSARRAALGSMAGRASPAPPKRTSR